MKRFILSSILYLGMVSWVAALTAPSNFVATPLSTSSIKLTWKDNSGSEQGFKIGRSTDGVTYTPLGNVGPNATAYMDRGLQTHKKYYYRIRSYNSTSISGFANIASAITFGVSTPTPTPSPTTTPTPTPSPSVTPTPIPGQGIASRYPGDVGIRSDPDVILADDFESYPTGLTGTALDNAFTSGPAHWSKVAGEGLSSITSEGLNGSKALRVVLHANSPGEQQVTVEKALTAYTTEIWQGRTVGTVVRNTNPADRTIYIRVYQKWDGQYLVSGANHNGIQLVGGLSGTGGMPPEDGSGWYTILAQNNFQGAPDTFDLAHSPFRLHLYMYWAGRTTDHAFPTGIVKGQNLKPGCTSQYPTCGGPLAMWGDPRWPHFNPPFELAQRPDFRPNKEQWYCYELGVTVNTLGNHDGEIRVWVDGELKLHYTDLMLMGAYNGKPYYIDRARIDLQANDHSNTVDAVKYYDHVVIAHSPIGPIAP